ncbi:hypothetical protein HK097_007791 [Rhizophlyctis rosea]|uniref:SH3 domain-containing protein n=1 Tax=Rhizophlyctis rosea TaxID=64517 RepID=A0AAD5X8L1_9FUNG|nr:hypothetical protein HK097_007791 [Rhizophlyctis rosea]
MLTGRILAIVAVVGLGDGVAAQVLGGACNPDNSVDLFGCQDNYYMTCDPTSRRWVLQNLCPNGCLNDPAFAANCGRNSQGISSPSSPSASAQPTLPSSSTSHSNPTVSSNPTATTRRTTSTPTNTTPTDPSTSTTTTTTNPALIYGPILGALLLLVLIALTIILLRRRRKPSNPSNVTFFGKKNTTLSRGMHDEMALGGGAISLASVLEKQYIVMHDYEPQADDEIRLRVGDYIRLSLLFNDGWAKGMNETTGKHGLLPCACVAEIPANNAQSPVFPGQPAPVPSRLR